MTIQGSTVRKLVYIYIILTQNVDQRRLKKEKLSVDLFCSKIESYLFKIEILKHHENTEHQEIYNFDD